MPASFLSSLNTLCLQSAVLFGTLGAVLFLTSRYSLSQLQQTPAFAERADLMHQARWGWLLLPASGLAATLVLYALMRLTLLPMTALLAGLLCALLPLEWAVYRRPTLTDGLMIGPELRRTQNLPQWLQGYRRRVERRERLGWLRHVSVVLTLVLAAIGGSAAMTFDPLLKTRLSCMAVAEELQQSLGPAVTVFSRTPPCVPQPTMMLVPPRATSRGRAEAYVSQVTQWLRSHGERRAWLVKVTEGVEPPLAAGAYSP